MVAAREAEPPVKSDRPTPPAPALAPDVRPPLQYDREAGRTVSVRGFRWLVGLTLVNTVLLGSMVLGPQLFPYARQQWQQWKDARAHAAQLRAELAAQRICEGYSPAATKVVYEEDPKEAVKLLKVTPPAYETVPGRQNAPPGWQPPVKAAAPDTYAQVLRAAYGSAVADRDQALLFLHERTTPAGERLLVSVSLRSDFRFNSTYSFGGSVQPREVLFKLLKQRMVEAHWWPVGPSGPSVDARGKARLKRFQLALPDNDLRDVARLTIDEPVPDALALDYGNVLRFFAGQADAEDPGRFTIAYELDGRPGVIEGQLRDDGLELRPRDGQRTYARDGEAWKLPAATRPTTSPAE
jgi:hypothetical protein